MFCNLGRTASSRLNKFVPALSILSLLGIIRSTSSMAPASASSSATASSSSSLPPLNKPYPIGIPGTPWTDKEKLEWLNTRKAQRSYPKEVVSKLLDDPIEGFDIEEYGQLTVENKNGKPYPLYIAKSNNWDTANKPSVLITGGYVQSCFLAGAPCWSVACRFLNILLSFSLHYQLA